MQRQSSSDPLNSLPSRLKKALQTDGRHKGLARHTLNIDNTFLKNRKSGSFYASVRLVRRGRRLRLRRSFRGFQGRIAVGSNPPSKLESGYRRGSWDRADCCRGPFRNRGASPTRPNCREEPLLLAGWPPYSEFHPDTKTVEVKPLTQRNDLIQTPSVLKT